MRAKAPIPGTVKRRNSFINSENASAIALAAVILFALVFTVYTVIHVEYVPEWKNDAEYAHMNEVWADMGTVKSSVDSLIVLMGSDNLSAEAGTSISVPLSMGGGEIPIVGTLKSGGTLAVNENPHTVEITIRCDNYIYQYTYDCGTLTFHSNNRYYVDQIFWFENGALIFEQDSHYLMKLQPSFINFRKAGNKSNIYINPVELLGGPDSISGNSRGSLKLSANNLSQISYPTNKSITLNISTKYPQAWENYFSQTTGNAGLSSNEYALSSTDYSVNFTYLNTGHDNLNIYIRQAEIKADIVVGGDGNTAWEYDEEDPILPVANFTANVTNGPTPLTVQFTNTSENTPEGTAFFWDFGDGKNSSEQNPIHIYNISGNCTVSLTVNNSNGSDSETKVNYITVSESKVPIIYPVANFTANITNGPAPLTVQFTDTSTNGTSWLWDFNNDGIVDSIEQNPSWTYNTSGSYTVNLTVSNVNGTDSEIKFDYINAGVLLTEEWYPYNNASVTGDTTIDVEDLQDYGSGIEGYFVQENTTYEPLPTSYTTENYTSSDINNQGSLELDFNFINFNETGSNISYVTILIIYAYDNAKDDKHMPPIEITFMGKNVISIPKDTLIDNRWYVSRSKIPFDDTQPTVSEITSQLNVFVDGDSRKGVFLIDYVGVYLGGEG